MTTQETECPAKRRYMRAGKIRVGAMLPSKACRANEKAMALYYDGIARGIKFDAIIEQIAKETGIKHALYPDACVPFFRMASEDFPMPEVRDRILAKYGEDRGNGFGRQLYAFPINVLSLDDILVGYREGKGDPLHESFLKGEARMCRTVSFAPAQNAGKRTRKATPIYEVKGPCEPKSCQLAISGKCRWRADIWFQIPGIGVRSMFQLSTGSESATGDLIQELKRIWSAHDKAGQTWLTKKQVTTHFGSKPYVIWLMELDADPALTQAALPCDDAMPPEVVGPDLPALAAEPDPRAGVWMLLEQFALKDDKAVLDYLLGQYGDFAADEAKCQEIVASLKKFQKYGTRAGLLFQIKMLVDRHGLDSQQVHQMLKEAVAPDYILHEATLAQALAHLLAAVQKPAD